jgi:hypothetical protein
MYGLTVQGGTLDLDDQVVYFVCQALSIRITRFRVTMYVQTQEHKSIASGLVGAATLNGSIQYKPEHWSSLVENLYECFNMPPGRGVSLSIPGATNRAKDHVQILSRVFVLVRWFFPNLQKAIDERILFLLNREHSMFAILKRLAETQRVPDYGQNRIHSPVDDDDIKEEENEAALSQEEFPQEEEEEENPQEEENKPASPQEKKDKALFRKEYTQEEEEDEY